MTTQMSDKMGGGAHLQTKTPSLCIFLKSPCNYLKPSLIFGSKEITYPGRRCVVGCVEVRARVYFLKRAFCYVGNIKNLHETRNKKCTYYYPQGRGRFLPAIGGGWVRFILAP